MKKAVTAKPSIPKRKLTKPADGEYHIINDYLAAKEGMCFFRQIPLSETVAQLIADEFVEDARNNEEEAITIKRFCKKRGIHKDTFLQWCKKFPCLAAAREIAKGFIADNREVGAIKKKLDFKTIAHNQYQYDSEWKEGDRHHAELRKKDDQVMQASNFKIVMQPDEKTDEVKEKK